MGCKIMSPIVGWTSLLSAILAVLAAVWGIPKYIYFNDGPLHSGALLLFTGLIPFFSIGAVVGLRRVASRRLSTLVAAFPAIPATSAFQSFAGLPGKPTASKISTARYIMPLFYLMCLNFFMSMLVLDGSGWTDNAISAQRKVFLLCGSRCVETTGDLSAYETNTLVWAAYAFVGWMVWSFVTIFDRAATQQLFPATFNRLLIRLAVALLVAIMVRHTMADFPAAVATSGPAVAFVVGMFPQRGLTFISQKVDFLAAANDRSDNFSLELIQGIDTTMTYRLQELGIGSGTDLARCNPFTIFEAAAMPISVVIDWIAQAQLILWVQSDRFGILQKAGYRTIFDLVRLLRDPQSKALLQGLCDWTIPAGYDQIAAIEADGDYQRLRDVWVAMGSVAP